MKINFDKLFKTKFIVVKYYKFIIGDVTFHVWKMKHKCYKVYDEHHQFFDVGCNKTHLVNIVKHLIKQKGGVINEKKENRLAGSSI